MLTIKVPFVRPDLLPKTYQQDFIAEVQNIFTDVDVSVSFENNQPYKPLIEKITVADIASVTLSTDDTEIVLQSIIAANNQTSERLFLFLENKDYDLVYRLKKTHISNLLVGATFKEIDDNGDIVLNSVNGKTITISSGYDSYLCIYPEDGNEFSLESLCPQCKM